MKYIFYLIFFLLVFGINIALLQVFNIRLLVPGMVLIMLLSFAIERENFDAFFIAVVGGLWLDFYSASFPGTYTFAFLALVYALRLIVSSFAVLEVNWKLLSLSTLGSLGVVYLLVWAYTLVFYHLGFSQTYALFSPRWHNFFIEAIVDLVLLYPTFALSEWAKDLIKRLLARQPRRN